jgi:hypothetical protein
LTDSENADDPVESGQPRHGRILEELSAGTRTRETAANHSQVARGVGLDHM